MRSAGERFIEAGDGSFRGSSVVRSDCRAGCKVHYRNDRSYTEALMIALGLVGRLGQPQRIDIVAGPLTAHGKAQRPAGRYSGRRGHVIISCLWGYECDQPAFGDIPDRLVHSVPAVDGAADSLDTRAVAAGVAADFDTAAAREGRRYRPAKPGELPARRRGPGACDGVFVPATGPVPIVEPPRRCGRREGGNYRSSVKKRRLSESIQKYTQGGSLRTPDYRHLKRVLYQFGGGRCVVVDGGAGVARRVRLRQLLRIHDDGRVAEDGAGSGVGVPMRYKKRLTSIWSARDAIDFIGDFNNLPKWDRYVRQVRQTVGAGVGRGAEYHIAFAIAGDTVVMRYRTVEYEPGRLVVLEGKSNVADALDSIRVEETAQGTCLTYDADLRVHGWRRWLEPLLWFVFSVRASRVTANLQRILSTASGQEQR